MAQFALTYCIQHVSYILNSVTLKSRSIAVLYKIFRVIHKKQKNTIFGHSSSICFKVIAFNVYEIIHMISITLKSRSMSSMFYILQTIPKLNLNTKFHNSYSICYQVMINVYDTVHFDLYDLEK